MCRIPRYCKYAGSYYEDLATRVMRRGPQPQRHLVTTFDYLADLVFHNNRLAMLIDEPSCRDERPCLQCLQLLVTGLEAHLDD